MHFSARRKTINAPADRECHDIADRRKNDRQSSLSEQVRYFVLAMMSFHDLCVAMYLRIRAKIVIGADRSRVHSPAETYRQLLDRASETARFAW